MSRTLSPKHPDAEAQMRSMVEDCVRNFAVIEQCMEETRLSVAEEATLRLTRVRAFLDRATEARFVIATHSRNARASLAVAESVHQQDLDDTINIESSRMVGRGLAAEERSAMYRLKVGRAATSRLALIRSLAEEIRLFDQLARDAIGFIDGHRMESITMLRAHLSVSADEYSVARAQVPDANGELPGSPS